MFELIKQVFIILLSFTKFLATKCVSLNNEPRMIRPFLIELTLIWAGVLEVCFAVEGGG